MRLTFPYVAVPIRGAVVPPALPPGATERWRPFIDLRLINPTNGRSISIHQAVVDSGADDTVFPDYAFYRLGLATFPTAPPTHAMIWRGTRHTLQFARVGLELFDGVVRCQWTATVAFSPAPLPHALLGQTGCLEFFNYTGRGADRVSVLEPIPAFPGTVF